MRTNYTKIVATIGPKSDSYSIIESMVQAGVDVFRMNFSHGSYLNFEEIAKNVRKAAKKLNKNVSILQDLQGPKIRLGMLPKEGIKIKKGQKITLVAGSTKFDETKAIFPVQYKNLHKDVKKGSRLFIDDGIIQVEVRKVIKNEIHCTAKTDGILFPNKGINAPDSSISAKAVTEKDKKDLLFGLELGVDFVALSFVKSAKDIKELRPLIKNRARIIAKIERHEAVKNLEEIMKEADGIMIARGDLGVEIPPELVPIVQKSIIKLANRYGKPVITATQVLNSMVENPRPTRAEISDAANAVYDGTDAIMLSNETAVGKYPLKAVQTIARTISAVENELKKRSDILDKKIRNQNIPNLNATCLSACQLSLSMKADKLIIYTKDGYTAEQTMKHRVFIPSIILSPNENTLRYMSLLWGTNKVLRQKSFDEKEILNLLLKEKLVEKRNKVVIVYNAKNKGSVLALTV